MKREGVIKNVRDYLSRPEADYPYFVAFDAEDDLKCLEDEFPVCHKERISDFCPKDDAFPDIDRLFASIQKDYSKNSMLLGAGEYVSLSNHEHFIGRLFDIRLPKGKKIVIPLWNGFSFLQLKKKQDLRVDFLRFSEFDQQKKYWSIRLLPLHIKSKVDARNFKSLLKCLENGCEKELSATTVIHLDSKWVHTITSAYDLYCEKNPAAHDVPKELFPDSQWELFLDDNRPHDASIWSADSLLMLKMHHSKLDEYMEHVLGKTEFFADFKNNILYSILDFRKSDQHFHLIYSQWKMQMEKFSLPEIRHYILESRRMDGLEQLDYLTGNTMDEKLEMIHVISKSKNKPIDMSSVYPQLNDYLKDFKFHIPENKDLADLLTEYFSHYKQEKLFNQVSPSFREEVENISEERPYYSLPTRGSVLEKLKSPNNHLFWLDAMGCEYLGFIQKKAEDLELKLKVHATRALLPTLTSVNKNFYEEWNTGTKEQSKKLDSIKHGDFDDCGYDRGEQPLELASELEVIESVMTSIASRLKAGKSKKVVLTSDHGATRLAVISGNETLWEMPEKGKHSGRCCRTNEFDGDLPPCVTHDDDNVWNVLANYNRFRGGRQADVEVHGGATLEEIVVPVIEFELADQSIHVEVMTKEIKTSFKEQSIKLVLFCVQPLLEVSVDFEGQRCPGKKMPENNQKYEIILPRPKAGDYSVVVYDGDSRIGEVSFSVKISGMGVKKDDFF